MFKITIINGNQVKNENIKITFQAESALSEHVKEKVIEGKEVKTENNWDSTS